MFELFTRNIILISLWVSLVVSAISVSANPVFESDYSASDFDKDQDWLATESGTAGVEIELSNPILRSGIFMPSGMLLGSVSFLVAFYPDVQAA